jgi:hypothetical protein
MPLVVKDRVRETTTTTGTGTVTLAGAVAGFQSFSAIGNANTTYYTINLPGANEWEVGIGTYTASGTTLSRDTILASSNSGSAVNFSAGTKDVFCTYPAGKSAYLDASNNLLIGTTTNTNTSNIVANGTISETVSGTQYLVASQYDVGTNPNQIPLNQYLGDMAFQSSAGVSVGALTASGAVTLSGGTANGVVYLNASKVATSGSALTFDGTNFATTGRGTFGQRVQITGNTAPSTGSGLELFFDGTVAAALAFARGTGYLPLGLDGSDIRFYASSSEQMRLNSSGLEVKQSQLIGYSSFAGIGSNGLAVLGNVGIGTSSPGTFGKLEVQTSGGTGVAIAAYSPSTTNGAKLTLFDNYSSAGIQSIPVAATVSSDLGFVSGASVKMRLNSSGNLGLGVTPSAWGAGPSAIQMQSASIAAQGTNTYWGSNWFGGGFDKYIATATASASLLVQTGGAFLFNTAGAPAAHTAGDPISFTQAMTLDASGNLLVGKTSGAGYKFEVTGNGLFLSNTSAYSAYLGQANIFMTTGAATDFAIRSDANLLFGAGGSTERARITSGGYFKASSTGIYVDSAGGYHELIGNTNADWTARIRHTNSTLPYGVIIEYNNASPNGTGSEFIYCADSGPTLRMSVRSNGGIANYQANDVNLSDERLKTDIVPVASYWNKIRSLEIVSFKYKDQTDDVANIGVIAQQVESVAPEFVSNDGFGKDQEGEAPYKTIYTTDMYHAAIKALQEAMARIETLEAEVAALKGA